jgi:hypothetical protein
MANENIITPQLSLPFQFVDNTALEVEQGDDGEIQQAIYAVLAYEPGQLMCNPQFGVPEPTFAKAGVNIQALNTAILFWEKRADEILERDTQWYMKLIDTITIRRNYS